MFTELKDMLESNNYGSRDASNDLLHKLGYTNEYLDTIKGEIDSKLTYLKSRDDYCSQKACDAITDIKDFCWSLTPGAPNEKMCDRLVDYMLEQGLGQLIVKMLVSLTGKNDNSAFESRRISHIALGKLVFKIEQQCAKKVKVKLVKCGIIRALLDDLDSCDPKTDDPRQRIRISANMYELYNLVNTEKVIPIYRAAKAVDILMKFARAENVMTRIDSLRLLACIINEKESQLLVANTGCISTMVEMIQKAAESKEREYTVFIQLDDMIQSGQLFSISLLSLTRGIGNLATNDANKEAIVQHDGVPAITALLRDEYKEEERQAAAEALWKLSFLESNVDVILQHLTYTDEEALKGRF